LIGWGLQRVTSLRPAVAAKVLLLWNALRGLIRYNDITVMCWLVDAQFQSLRRSSGTHCHLTSNLSHSLLVFRQRLKTFLFRQSFRNIVL